MNPNVNVNMPNMNPMGGPVGGGAPVPMMNNGAMNPQGGPAAPGPRQQQLDNQRGVLNTYIYEYFIRYGMYECARSLLSSDQQVNVHKDGSKGGNAVNGASDDAMDADNKDDIDSKLPDDLPPPKLPMPASDQSFLYEWFCLFWDIYNAQRAKSGNPHVNQYVNHTQTQQQEMLRQMQPNMAQQQYHQMMRMQNGMNMKQPGNLARAAMANNQNNPQMQQMLQQQAKQNQMQRDPSQMDGNRDRPASPASGENAPSPSKRQRIDNVPFNPNQPGMMPNGRPVQGMPPQHMAGAPNAAAAQQMIANGINPGQLQQFQNFQHHGGQMGNKQMPNAGGPQGQGSPLMQGPDGTTLNNYYNPPGGDMGGPNGMRAGPGGAQAAGGSNHALQDYQMQLMLLEQQNKKRLMMARQEQDNIGGMPREGQPGPGGPVPTGPNGQPFPEASPQAMRSGTSPNPADQMKRGTPQMNNSGIPSPVPEGSQQSRGSPNPGMNFMNNADPNMAPHFFQGKDGQGNMNAAQAAQMNGMRPPSSHPGQPFNGQMNPQMLQQQRAQGQNPQQWQQGPNGQMVPQGMPQNPQVQGTPQQRAMPPPSAPANAAGNNANNRTTQSPQQASAQPPTPNQGNKAAPKKKETKGGKKGAANKKNQNANNSNNNTGATPAGENNAEGENPPQTPITPVTAGFKNGQNTNQPAATSAAAAPSAAPAPSAAVGPPHGQPDPNNGLNMNDFGSMNFMELDNPLQTGDVLNDFDFDSFLHDGEGDNQPFDFNGAFTNMDGGEISTE